MNSSDNSKRKHENVDQFDDLTRFLDEDFDTDDVDLFEFTTEEDSPLTGLKSIVLSLDWEITDETLDELADELARLKNEEMFLADKVSQVYLQGLSKIGQYILSEGAHAHPNAIKLLLTFYYDFEKILSSETITGTEITALLKADVRKFKILQYQIAKKHGVAAPVPAAEEAKKMGLVYTDSEALRGIRAAILELDWEVTDEGLDRLAEQLDKLKDKFADNRFIKVLLQGLFSIRSYISEEKGRAHPEAYTLLHTFSEAIAKLIENDGLDDEQRQEIIVEQINGLNNLKSLIAQSAAVEELGEEAIEEVERVEEKTADFEKEEVPSPDEVPALTEKLSEEEEEEEEPVEDAEIAPALADDEAEGTEIREDEAPPEELTAKLESFFGPDEQVAEPEDKVVGKAEAPSLDEEAEEEIIAPAFADREDEEDIAPALADDEAEGTEITEEEPPEELEERLEFFFGEDEEASQPEPPAPEPQAAQTPVAEPPETKHEEPVAEIEDELEPFEEDSLAEDIEIEPALAGDESEGTEIEEEAPPEELTERLEFFFGTDEEVASFEEKPPEAPESEKISEPAETESEAEEEEEEIVPALSGSPEEAGYGPGEDEAPPEGLAEKLEGFFGDEEAAPEETSEIPAEKQAEAGFEAMFEDEDAEKDEEIAPALHEEEDVAPALFEEGEEETETAPALADEEEDVAPALFDEGEEGSEIIEETPPEELSEKLEFFFGDEKEEKEEEPETGDEEFLLTSAVTEEVAPPGEERARPVKSEEEYQAAVAQIRSHFKKIETSLKQEIASLKDEVETLRRKLKEQ